MIFLERLFNPSERLPVSDHEQSEDAEKHIGPGEKSGQSTDGKKQSFPDKKKYMLGSLSLEKEIKFGSYSFRAWFSRIEDLNLLCLGLQNLVECLLLPEDSLRKKHEFLFSQFPEFFPAGSLDLDWAYGIG